MVDPVSRDAVRGIYQKKKEGDEAGVSIKGGKKER